MPFSLKRILRWTERKIYFPIIAPCIFFVLEIIVRPKKGIVIISLPKARIYADNSRYFFEYCANDPDNNVFLLTKSKQVFKEVQDKYPGKVLYAYSRKALWNYLRANVLFTTHNKWDFHPYYPIGNFRTFVNLWHGTPLKRVNHLHYKRSVNNKNQMKYCKYYITSSEFTKYLMATQFEIHIDDILVTGQPRNDALFTKDEKLLEKHPVLKKKVILYAPTFRSYGRVRLFPFDDFDKKKLLNFLEEHDAYILIRCHINEWIAFKEEWASEESGSDRIIMADVQRYECVQELLRHTDILVSDYSSIHFDFSLLNRPMIFLPYDIEEYIKHRGLNVDYNKNTPGPKVSSFQEFLSQIHVYLTTPSKDEAERIKVRDKYNLYLDDQSSKRVWESIKSLGLVY